MKKVTILITGGGAPGIAGTIYALQNNPDRQIFRIITTDVKADVVGRYLADSFYKVPPPEHKDFIKTVIKIAKKENAGVVLPQTTRELLVFAKHRKVLIKEHISIVISSYQSIKVASDKLLLLEKAKNIGVPCPLYFLTNSQSSLKKAVYDLGYPKKKVVVKPRLSNGMRGLRIITKNVWNAKKFFQEKPDGIEVDLESLFAIFSKGLWPELLVAEYLPGAEYTVDVFRNSNITVAIPRLREKIRSGITFDAKVELRKDLIEFSKKLSRTLDLRFCFGFQFKLSDDGMPKILECNPRVQGTMVLSIFAGFNVIYYSVMEALGKKMAVKKTVLKEGINFMRYWGGLATYENKFIGRI